MPERYPINYVLLPTARMVHRAAIEAAAKAGERLRLPPEDYWDLEASLCRWLGYKVGDWVWSAQLQKPLRFKFWSVADNEEFSLYFSDQVGLVPLTKLGIVAEDLHPLEVLEWGN